MIKLTGQYNTAIVFAEKIEQSATVQIEHLLNQPFTQGSKIRIMPDAHAGIGCTIGTTMTIADKLVPNLVGVDIGCGMETAVLKEKRIDVAQFDKAVRQAIPCGFEIRRTPHIYRERIDLSSLICAKHVDLKRAELSIGTLGGGNHFIEIDHGENGRLYLVVHSGSRNLGKQVCAYYQNLAAESLGRKGEGEDRVLAYLTGELLEAYIHDMDIVQRYADINRRAIVRELEKFMNLKIEEQFTTIHNYIELHTMILRKGAISAKKGERVLIPMNMRDGSLICIGKGNSEWNNSAPHGAGRLMSRTDAKHSITLTEFKAAMKGIYSSTINKNTIDEAPQAYKPMEEIIKNMKDSVEILEMLKPIYNFKGA